MSRVVVLGGGESGVGSAVLAKVKGYDVFLSDMGQIPEKYTAVLDQWEIPYEQGRHSEELILNADEVVKSPGIPPKAPMVQKIVENGIGIISEIEFAGRYDTAKKVCITGSNGKTTTTSLIYHLLQQAGLNVGLGGNIGKSYAYQVATEQHDLCPGTQQFPAGQRIRFQGGHCHHHQHHSGSSGQIRLQDGELCKVKVPHHT